MAKAKSKISAPTASPPSAVASPIRPTTAVSVSPISGVVRKASVIGRVIFQTSRWVTAKGRERGAGPPGSAPLPPPRLSS